MGVWIDTDMGFDDIAAILVVTGAKLDIAGISLVFGNTPLPQVRTNAARAAKAFGWAFPIHSGRASAVLGEIETAQAILGETGIPTSGKTLPEAEPLPESDAFTALCSWLETDGPHRILALGPLTNIAALALARPDLAARITELTWMGGGVTSGNHTASAEFNALADPEALAIVIAHGLPLRMVDLDLCRKVIAMPDDVAPSATPVAPMPPCLPISSTATSASAPAAAAPAWRSTIPAPPSPSWHPEIVSFRAARIDVELQGSLTRGRTVVETRASHAAPNAEYAIDIDAEAARAIILGALAGEARK
jgi:purine nucleosidase